MTRPFRTYRGVRFTRSQIYLIFHVSPIQKLIISSVHKSLDTTAGMLISFTVGLRHNFCYRGPILIPRPDSETSAQTTRAHVLDFFVKPKNGISAFYTKRR